MGVNVRDWLQYNTNEEQVRKLFYNMSTTMKYIHSYNYYISSFNLSEIEIKNTDTLTPIQYNYVNKMSNDDDSEIIKQNIFFLALLQVAVYTNTVDTINANFLKENFRDFEMFLPEIDVAYLRGVIQRYSPVYYCDYVTEKNKKELEKLENELGQVNTVNEGIGIQKSKATLIGTAFADKETQKLYSSLEDKQAAFTSFMILPIIMILLGFIMIFVIIFMH